MTLTRIVNGREVVLSASEEAELRAEWAANEIDNDARKAAEAAMKAQVDSEKSDLPSWGQVVNAINNAFPVNAQANIIKKIARPVYTYLKKSVN